MTQVAEEVGVDHHLIWAHKNIGEDRDLVHVAHLHRLETVHRHMVVPVGWTIVWTVGILVKVRQISPHNLL